MDNAKKLQGKVADGISKGADAMKNFTNELMSDGNCYLVVVYLVCIIFLVIFTYSLYLKKELSKADANLKKMKEISILDAPINALSPGDYNKKDTGNGNDSYFSLMDYNIMGSYNSCCSGPVINGHVSLEALNNVIKQGVRFLDFEIYLKNNEVVVAAGRNNIYIKDTLNELNLGEVLEEVKNKALGTVAQNNTDPLILQFRIMSGNSAIYDVLAKSIKKNFKNHLASANYGKGGIIVQPNTEGNAKNRNYSGNGKNKFKNNILYADLRTLKNKVIISVKDHDDFLGGYKGNRALFELVNIGNATNDTNVYWISDYDINTSSLTSTIEENKYNYCVTYPNVFNNKENSKASLHFRFGCQAILMNFGAGFDDTQMKFYKEKFQNAGKAFLLKPENLRRTRLFLGAPTPPDPQLGVVQEKVYIDYGGPEKMYLGYMPGGGHMNAEEPVDTN